STQLLEHRRRLLPGREANRHVRLILRLIAARVDGDLVADHRCAAASWSLRALYQMRPGHLLQLLSLVVHSFLDAQPNWPIPEERRGRLPLQYQQDLSLLALLVGQFGVRRQGAQPDRPGVLRRQRRRLAIAQDQRRRQGVRARRQDIARCEADASSPATDDDDGPGDRRTRPLGRWRRRLYQP